MPQTATFNRADTLLGVCEAIGQDLGFNPLWLRLALTLGLFWNAAAMIGLYVGLAVVVHAVRWLTPARRLVPAAPAVVRADNDEAAVDVKAAA